MELGSIEMLFCGEVASGAAAATDGGIRLTEADRDKLNGESILFLLWLSGMSDGVVAAGRLREKAVGELCGIAVHAGGD